MRPQGSLWALQRWEAMGAGTSSRGLLGPRRGKMGSQGGCSKPAISPAAPGLLDLDRCQRAHVDGRPSPAKGRASLQARLWTRQVPGPYTWPRKGGIRAQGAPQKGLGAQGPVNRQVAARCQPSDPSPGHCPKHGQREVTTTPTRGECPPRSHPPPPRGRGLQLQ